MWILNSYCHASRLEADICGNFDCVDSAMSPDIVLHRHALIDDLNPVLIAYNRAVQLVLANLVLLFVPISQCY